MSRKNESSEAGKHQDMGIKTVQGQDNEGHINGSNQAKFDERQTQEIEKNDNSDLNRRDAREDMHGNI